MKKGEECHCEFVVLFRRCRVRELREELSWAEHKQTELHGSRQREMQAEAASERRRLREQEAEVQQIKRDSGALKRQAELKA